jgi:hypothetical protein
MCGGVTNAAVLFLMILATLAAVVKGLQWWSCLPWQQWQRGCSGDTGHPGSSGQGQLQWWSWLCWQQC